MKDNYTTYEVDGRFFRGVFSINGNIFRCSNRRSSKGAAVKEAAAVRRAKMNG
jgi:hypothetical protein